MQTIELNAGTADRLQALAQVRGEDEQTTFDKMLQRGLDAFQQERGGLNIRIGGDAAGRLETLSALYEVDTATMADRLIRKGIEVLDGEDGIPTD
ncbi:hypothetical protein [Marispirochaeta sp.]|uniref:hypothetical protein n=1 Tax=Marispirochaeta sp. TaxID=2038653 RepID=UPI0029C8C6A0|nr:hypothetical protein [Marispirochaeta sp.]